MLGTGIVTAYKGSGVINFAHGAFAMYAAFVYDELLTNGSLRAAVGRHPAHRQRSTCRSTSRSQEGGTSEGLAVVLGLLMAAAHRPRSPTCSCSGRCATRRRSARSSARSV